MSILDLFPLPFPPRDAQVAAIRECFEAFESGHRFVILEGPTGVGKSAIGLTLCRHYGKGYVCTLTKQLQEQYQRDFASLGAKTLKGRASFACERLALEGRGRDEGSSCQEAAIHYKYKPCSPDVCPHQLAKAAALRAPITVCNYHSYLYTLHRTPSFNPRRPLLILDEAHECEDVLLSHVSVVVDTSALPFRVSKPPPDAAQGAEACFAWLELLLEEGAALLDKARNGEVKLSEKAEGELDSLLAKTDFALKHEEMEEWISEPLDRKTGFALKPLTVRGFGEKLFRWGDRVLLMSATVLDAKTLAKSIGIEDYAFVQAPCPFPKENRQVYVGGLNMTKAWREESWPVMVTQVEVLLELHAEEKGLILTPSNQMIDYLLERLSPASRARCVVAVGKNRVANYEKHLASSEPTVLVASGLWEGADLKGESSRFQILPSVPRPYWSGQVAARARLEPGWYRWKSFAQLIQGLGRSIRSEEDFASSYVLDGALRDEAARTDTILPPWFREALESM